eukprot:6177076-Pleurochrysis_carterae.AAC.1
MEYGRPGKAQRNMRTAWSVTAKHAHAPTHTRVFGGNITNGPHKGGMCDVTILHPLYMQAIFRCRARTCAHGGGGAYG